MGQARLRGTPEQRKAAAIDRQMALRPKFITCNNCQARLTDMAPMDIDGLDGIQAAFTAHCPACGHDTYALKGEPEAVARLHMAIEDNVGAASKAGVVPPANRPDPA